MVSVYLTLEETATLFSKVAVRQEPALLYFMVFMGLTRSQPRRARLRNVDFRGLGTTQVHIKR